MDKVNAKAKQLRTELQSTKGNHSIFYYLLCIKAMDDLFTSIGDPITFREQLEVMHWG